MKRKVVLLTLISLLASCGHKINPDPVDDNISLTDLANALTKIESNFKGEVKESLIYDGTDGFNEIRSASALFEKASSGDYHLHRKSYDYDGVFSLEELRAYVCYYEGYEPEDPRIEEKVDEILYGTVYINGAHSHAFSDEEMVKEDNEIKVHLDLMNYLGHIIDTSGYNEDYLADYIDYYKVFEGPITHEYFGGNRKTKKDYHEEDGDAPKNDILYFVYDLKNEVEHAIYDKNEKSYTFSSDFLLNYGDFGNKYVLGFDGGIYFNDAGPDVFNNVELKIEFNPQTKDISKFTLAFKGSYDDDVFPAELEYDLEFDYLGELNSDIEIEGYHKKCNHEYVSYSYNDKYHYCYCNGIYDCKKVISYEPHEYDENGVCKGCGYIPYEYYDVVGDHVPVNNDTIFYYAVNSVTNKIGYYSYEDYDNIDRIYSIEDSVLKDEVFKGDDIYIAAEKDYASKDSYYILVHTYEDISPNCIWREIDYSYMYHVENGVPTLIGEGLYLYEENDHCYEVVEGSLSRIDDGTCKGTIKCLTCGQRIETEFYCYLYDDYDYDEKEEICYVYLSCRIMSKPYKPESHQFHYYDIEFDENGFETLTHTHKGFENFGNETIGIDAFLIRYNGDGSIWNIQCKNPYSLEYLDDGFKYTFKNFGDNVVEMYETRTTTKEKDTCILHAYDKYRIVVNGVTIFEELSEDEYEGFGEAAAEHNFEYVEGSLEYNPYFDEYTFKARCKDCGKEVLVEKDVSIHSNYDGKTHELHGYYYFDLYDGEDVKEVTVTCDCEPSEENKDFCKWCESYIGEIE